MNLQKAGLNRDQSSYHVCVPAVEVLKASPRGGSEAPPKHILYVDWNLKIMGRVSRESRPSVEGGNDS